MLLGGERSSKSMLASLLAGLSLDISIDEAEYWIVGPDYRQTRAEFRYLYNVFKNAGFIRGKPSMPANETSPWSMSTTFDATFKTRSSIEVAALASFSVHGVIMVEAGQQEQEVFLKMMGRIAETDGFLIINGTLEKGQPWYIDLFKQWRTDNDLGARSFSMPTWSNVAVFPGGRNDPRIKRLEATYPPDLFGERFGAEPRKLQGVVIPEFDLQTHVRTLEVDPLLPVEMWVDPGQHCYAILFVQNYGLRTFVLDRIYVRNMIVHDVVPLAMEHTLWKYINLDEAGVIDNAGKQHQANKSQIELWREISGANLRGHYHYLDDTIETVRFRLLSKTKDGEPLVLFNSHMTTAKTVNGMAIDILAEFELWKWPDRATNMDMNTPVKPVDRNNDAIKALGYGLIDHYGIHTEKPELPDFQVAPYWGVPGMVVKTGDYGHGYRAGS